MGIRRGERVGADQLCRGLGSTCMEPKCGGEGGGMCVCVSVRAHAHLGRE